ncbi:hypothetical protein [Nostoc sp. JL23]|uniref:hypothetical protein n=1 Tax=Nostoc sp. JL23 TaxID=2815394 RepID=UPI001DEB40C4|nr:hypothetical protein [Nostoc sp. JL23]MBN3875143.1 hypothetical protein [Nostoc sp. JL23]
MSQNGVVHLMDSEELRSQTWLTLCGRKIWATHALPLQKFNASENCCTVCVRMQRSNSLLHSRLLAA